MKQLQFIILALALFALSCSNRKAPGDSTLREYLPIDTISAPAKTYTIVNEEPAKVSSSSHRCYHSDKNLDNMLGFDPASEDDMDDNGR